MKSKEQCTLGFAHVRCPPIGVSVLFKQCYNGVAVVLRYGGLVVANQRTLCTKLSKYVVVYPEIHTRSLLAKYSINTESVQC
jgi:hypothetical protein